MTREQLEHVIRASATIADDDEIIVIARGMVTQETLRRRLEGAPIDEPTRQRIAAFITRDYS